MSDSGPKILSRDEILEADDLPIEMVEVPEWGGAVYVRAMTGTERDAFEASITKISRNGKGATAEADMTNVRAKLLARTIVDADGNRLFSDTDIKELGGKAARPLDRLFGRAKELSGIGEEDIEEMVGNSDSGQSDTSTSSSASVSAARTQTTSSGS